MLDQQTKDQLKSVFSSISNPIELIIHDDQSKTAQEMKALIGGVVETSNQLSQTIVSADHLQLDLTYNGQPTGVIFRGVPGGHEFTSLILAILHADGQGKWPDEGIVNRMKAIKGPVKLTTYIALSCTNCPDVVQALNQMAFVHDQFSHEMVDGGIYAEEVKARGIQGVPAVFAGDEMIHVGKASLIELLEKLEAHFGKEAVSPNATPQAFDVVVAGGGPAGVSAAIYSARKGLKTALVAERLGGQVKDTKGIENMISQIYTEGPNLANDLEKHLREYEVTVLEHRRIESLEKGGEKRITLTGGEVITAPSVIIATGAKWRELGVEGEKEYLGRGVAFCPHCDGPFYKGRDVAVIGGGNSGVEAAIDLAGICNKVTLIEFAEELKADEVLVKALAKHPNIEVKTNRLTKEIVGDGQQVTGLNLTNRANEATEAINLDGVFVQIGLVPNSGFAKEVVKINRFGEIETDGHCRTSEPGIYAAGDVSTVPYKQIIISMGEGAKAALSAFDDRVRGIS